MVKARTGKYLEVFWGREASWKDGISNHQAFNPMAQVGIPKPTYKNTNVKTAESLENTITYTELLEPGEKDLEMYFRDPFLMAAFFTHKSCVYGSGSGVMDFDFSDNAHEDSIWMHFHEDHATAPIDRTLKGGMITSYGLKIAGPGQPLMETIGTKFVDIDLAPGDIPMALSSDFQNQAFGISGGWASYDDNIPQALHAKDLSVTYSGTGALAGIGIETFDFKATTVKEHGHTSESRVASVYWEGDRDFEFSVTGFIKTLEEYEEVENAYENKTPGIIKIYIEDTVGEEKYFQITNAYIDTLDNFDIPKASEAKKGTIKIVGGAGTKLSFHGEYVKGVDPSDQITVI